MPPIRAMKSTMGSTTRVKVFFMLGVLSVGKIRNPNLEIRNKPEVGKIRNPNLEIRNKPEIQNPKAQTAAVFLVIRFLVLEFVSDFGFRISDFRSSLAPLLQRIPQLGGAFVILGGDGLLELLVQGGADVILLTQRRFDLAQV